jgi:hypothetical protein
MKNNYIFELRRNDYKYKGILFAEIDFAEIDNKEDNQQMGSPMPMPENFIAGAMAIIWIDEKGIWHAKMRIKFPSGSKQVMSRDYLEEFKHKLNINETYVLQDLYRIPMKNKCWYPNKTEDIDGMVKILQESDMLESYKVISEEEA